MWVEGGALCSGGKECKAETCKDKSTCKENCSKNNFKSQKEEIVVMKTLSLEAVRGLMIAAQGLDARPQPRPTKKAVRSIIR